MLSGENRPRKFCLSGASSSCDSVTVFMMVTLSVRCFRGKVGALIHSIISVILPAGHVLDKEQVVLLLVVMFSL